MKNPIKPKSKIGPWSVESHRNAYENPWIRVDHHDVIHPNGQNGTYGVVRFHNLAIGVLPIDQGGNVWLVGQHRFAFDKYSWELPEGGVPFNEDPLAGAKRELQEETGLTAKGWAEIGRFDLSNSVSDEQAIGYVAYDLMSGDNNPDPSEQLTIKKLPFHQLLQDIMTGTITDSLTILITLKTVEMVKHQIRGKIDLPSSLPQAICKLVKEQVRL